MEPRELLASLFETWRNGDALRAVAHFSIDAVYREARGDAVTGRAAITEHFTRFFRDGPAWRFEADETIVEGNRAAVGYRFSVEGSDRIWRERAGCALVRFADGTITEWREYEG